MSIYKATKYRYADGVSYRQNIYKLQRVEEGFDVTVGGMIVLEDKVFAFAGFGNMVQEKIKSIINNPNTSKYVWGASIQEVLAKIRPFLDYEP